MSDRVNLEFRDHGVTTLLSDLQGGERKIKRAIRNASNRTGTKAKKKLAQEVTKEYVIGSGKLKSEITFQRASGNYLFARLMAKGNASPLIEYKVSPKCNARHTKRGYSPKVYKAQVKKESGWKLLNGSPKPFVQTMRSGHVGVFRRIHGEYTSTGKSKIEQLYTLSIPQMIENEEVLKETQKMSIEEFVKRLDHELNFVFGGRNG